MTTNLVDKYRVVDLFAGTGAFSWAFTETGMATTVFSNDMENASKTIYDLNFNHPLVKADLNTLDTETIPSHDILTAGFPCQPFSIAGEKQGFQDARSNVFWKILEIINHHQPRFVILENVRNLCSHNEGRTFETISDNIQGIGYQFVSAILDTAKVTTIPQHRERIYIVCFRDPDDLVQFNMTFAETASTTPVHTLMSNTEVPSKYYYSDRFKIWPAVEEGVTKHINTDTVYQFRRYYVRGNKNQQCPTLTANMGGGGHNVPLILDDNGVRKLTPRECFNFQGFPESYQLPTNLSDSALYKLAGNAVSVPVVELLANRLVTIFPPSVTS